MADLRPFRALRPTAEFTDRVAAPPYDVIDTDEARAIVDADPLSFLKVSRPESAFRSEQMPDAETIRRHGRQALDDLVSAGVLVMDDAPSYGIYRQQRDTHIQVGVVALAGVRDYTSGLIKKHEHTRPDKENDRTAHIVALSAHDEPVLLMTGFDDPVWETLAPVLERAMLRPATTSNTDPDGVVHDIWRLDDVDEVSAVAAGLGGVLELFIADGHHRSAAAARADRDLRGVAGADAMLAVIFPAEQLVILPYHRVVTDLCGRDLDTWLADLGAVVTVQALGPAGHPQVAPDVPRQWGMYTAGTWYRLTAPPTEAESAETTNPVTGLDVSLLQDLVLSPLLGIHDPRTNPRIAFVGGARGTAELERLVDSGLAEVAFAMYPTTVEQLIAVTDTGQVMPPKSTWFEPKLRSGLFVHPLG